MADWYLSSSYLSCEKCFADFSSMGLPTPCEECLMPALLPDNSATWQIFEVVRSQIRTAGMGDFVGYDLSLVPFLVQAYGIPQSEWEDVINGIALLNAEAVRISVEERKAREDKS